MFRLDMRAGSQDYLHALRAAGLPVEAVAQLPAGDVEIVGRGPGGRPVLVGIELKKCADFLTCVRDGRLSEQLRRMRDRFEVRWIVVEGEWRLGAGDALEMQERRGWKARGQVSYQEAASYSLTLAQRGGALLWRTGSEQETVSWLRTMYWWWVGKDFEEHRAHLDLYTPPYVPPDGDHGPPSVEQKVAAALLAQGNSVNVGGDRARAVAAHFGTLGAMFSATEKDWRQVEGIGPKLAKQMVSILGRES